MASLIEEIRTELDGRHDVERELGRGAMTTVVLARDHVPSPALRAPSRPPLNPAEAG